MLGSPEWAFRDTIHPRVFKELSAKIMLPCRLVDQAFCSARITAYPSGALEFVYRVPVVRTLHSSRP